MPTIEKAVVGGFVRGEAASASEDRGVSGWGVSGSFLLDTVDNLENLLIFTFTVSTHTSQSLVFFHLVFAEVVANMWQKRCHTSTITEKH